MRRPASTLPAARAPKLATVAKAAQVSIGLASRILNKDPTVSVRSETRARVESAAERLQYVPSASAQALRQRRTRVIGLAVHDLASTLVTDLLNGARDEATALDYLLLLTDADEIATNAASRRLYLHGARIDGLIIQDGHANLGGAIDEIAEQMPTVVFNTAGRALSPGVRVDEKLAGRLAAEHLLRAGHRRIGFIGGPMGTYTSSARLNGAASAVAAAGGTLHTLHGDWTAPSGRALLRQLMDEAPQTTGVITANLLIGTGAITAAGEAGRPVPTSLSVVAIQDSWAVDLTTPKLTTVALPLHELGRQAVHTLIGYIDGDDVSESQIVGGTPAVRSRQSVAAPAETASTAS